MKSTGPVISVITAACNSAATLEDTLRSVLGQDYTNVEHIVVMAEALTAQWNCSQNTSRPTKQPANGWFGLPRPTKVFTMP